MALSYQMGLQVGAHGGTLSNVPDPAQFDWSYQTKKQAETRAEKCMSAK